MAKNDEEMLVFIDEDCTKKEIRQIVKDLKRKYNQVSLHEKLVSVEKCPRLEPQTSINEKPEHLCVSDPEIKSHRLKRKRKLNSRLSRILKEKVTTKRVECKEVCDDDTDSDSFCSDDTTDSGIQCDDPRLQSELIDKTRIVALDCEFVGVGPANLSALGRCSIVNYDGEVICDVYAKPDQRITDYRTPWSGLRKSDMINALPAEVVKNHIRKVIQNKIVIGHALHNDFCVLGLRHPSQDIRDTAKCKILQKSAKLKGSQGGSLKHLTEKLLGRKIQDNEHCSIEDATAALDLYKLKENEWEHTILSKQKVQVDHEQTERSNSLTVVDSDILLNDEYWPDEI